MADYTYQELMRMQNDAIRRAEDMQARARKTAGIGEEKQEKTFVPSQEPKRIKMPEGYLGNGHKEDNIQDRKQDTVNNHNESFEKMKNSLADIAIDSDKALLLSLIMLLSEEKADELLIMALIYMLT